MTTNPPPGRNFGQRMEDLLRQVENELRHGVDYVNDQVVPEVRRESITAMRSLSEKLRNLADRLDQQKQDPRP